MQGDIERDLASAQAGYHGALSEPLGVIADATTSNGRSTVRCCES